MFNEASPQICVFILSCAEAESLIGKWFPYPKRKEKIIRGFVLFPLYLLQADSGSPILRFPVTFILALLPTKSKRLSGRDQHVFYCQLSAWDFSACVILPFVLLWPKWLTLEVFILTHSFIGLPSLVGERNDRVQDSRSMCQRPQLISKPENRSEPGSGTNFQDPTPGELFLSATHLLPNSAQL